MKRHIAYFDAGVEVLVSTASQTRLKGRRITVTTTRTEEAIED